MEFLSDYGLFLAKTITFVIAFAVIVVIAVSAGMRGQKKEKGHIEIEKINDHFDELKKTMQSELLTSDDLKQLSKDDKKAKKDQLKQAKKAKKKGADDVSVEPKKRVFVSEFDGDVKASDTDNLREVITAILTVATEKDEVVIKLESPGGMVHSYGLAASQLARITRKNIPLTIIVDKVAASGGYMMACVGSKILAAPFAVIGSIGVLAQVPNFNRLLKKHDVDYELFTAGEYKRTVTMFGENTEKGREKFKEDIEETHVLFKEFINENRPALDLEKVATGEVWYGSRALQEGLIDDIKTSDEYLLEASNDADLYSVKFEEKQNIAEKLGVSIQGSIERAVENVFERLQNRFHF